jgi:hypothetical protein
MADYVIKLTPNFVGPDTEGGLDTSVVNGVSKQRTGYFEVYNANKRKIVAGIDGKAFDDVIPTWTSNDNIEAA